MPSTPSFSSEAYSQYASAIQFSDLPSDISEVCKLILLDTLGAAIAASGVIDSSTLLTSYAKNAFGPGESPFWGCGAFANPMGASFANGALAHALNYDVLGAGYAGLIPPVVLAAADCNEKTSGQEV